MWAFGVTVLQPRHPDVVIRTPRLAFFSLSLSGSTTRPRSLPLEVCLTLCLNVNTITQTYSSYRILHAAITCGCNSFTCVEACCSQTRRPLSAVETLFSVSRMPMMNPNEGSGGIPTQPVKTQQQTMIFVVCSPCIHSLTKESMLAIHLVEPPATQPAHAISALGTCHVRAPG
jgi:hypothetical protein